MISIIIPTWNTSQITLRCITSLQQYLPRGFAQIIVVDNGSTDNTPKILGKLKTIYYLRNHKNLGFAAANNIGVKAATGDYFLFLNSDMEIIDDSLVNMTKYLQSHRQIGIISPKFLNPNDLSPQGSVFPPQTPLNAFKEFWLKRIGSYTKYVPHVTTPTSVWSVSGGAVLLSRADFEQIGGWDEKYFFYFEDMELCRQIRNLGKQIYFYPQCRVVHRHGASSQINTDSQNQWRRLIPGSIKFHGYLKHHLINFIIWSSQQWYKLFPALN